jgi:hypothetical protein
MMQKTLIAIVLLLFCSIRITAQQTEESGSPPSASAASEEKETTVLGCLSNLSGDFVLTDASGAQYHLVGDPELGPFVGHEMSISGTTSGSDPESPITVTDAKDVLNPAAPISSFVPSGWRTSTAKEYGLSFQYPETFNLLGQTELRKESNFANSNGATSLVSVEIPASIYPGSNFRGGYFTALVNPNISNAPACYQFGYADPRLVSTKTVHSARYAQAIDGEGAAGTGYAYYYLHTYQNGLCYEFKLEAAAVNTDAYDLPCSIPLISDQNKTDLLDSFLARITFFRPAERSQSRERAHVFKPEVAAFSPSSQPANHSLQITLSWTTRGVDYVHLEFACAKGLVVTGASAYLECGSSSNRNFPPNGSATFLVSNPQGHAPIPFVVVLVPFSQGVAYPSQTKTASIPVSPDPL